MLRQAQHEDLIFGLVLSLSKGEAANLTQSPLIAGRLGTN
jgi:hypothetical protein